MSCERTTRQATRLFQYAAADKIRLSQPEKNSLTTDYLFVLALTNKLVLNQHDKNRLRPLYLAQLAITDKIDLSQDDKQRLPVDLLFDVFVQGCATLTEHEMARFTPDQKAFLGERGVVSNDLSPVGSSP